MTLLIRSLQTQDIDPIAAAFTAIGWNKPASQYERYLAEQDAGQRIILVAFVDHIFAGYVTINWLSDYPHFRRENIPEIQDFNVLPHFRRQGIGSRLMDEAEKIIAQRSPIIGIGVGMDGDYGAAQRMYVKRGYIPDGRGLFFDGHFVKWGELVTVNDDLVLHFTKRLEQGNP
jgi:ribosomal protein S18 acetylase RimI-like enzyme